MEEYQEELLENWANETDYDWDDEVEDAFEM